MRGTTIVVHSAHAFAWLVASAVALAVSGCDSGIITDDWGPPAGYATVKGTVTRTGSGDPVAGRRVSIARCGSPIGGYFGDARTAGDGTYRIDGTLPPIGVLPNLELDTLRVSCRALVALSSTTGDSIVVRFYGSPGEVVPLVLDLAAQ